MTQAIATPTTKPLTFEEFLDFDDGTDNFYELIDGQIVLMSEAFGEHEAIRSNMAFDLEVEIRRLKLPLQTHPNILCKLSADGGRRPDLIVVDRRKWAKATRIQAALIDTPPELVIEIVSTNWQDDYQQKALWYAAFGVPEYWIVDPLLAIERYPSRKNPAIAVPTVSVSFLKDGAYQPAKRFTGNQRIESRLFPELALTVEQVMNAGEEWDALS